MEIRKINPILPTKQLTVNGCCDKIIITNKKTVVTFDNHKFVVSITYCSTCGSTKATSHIKEHPNAKSKRISR